MILYRVEVVVGSGREYQSEWMQLLYEYDGYFFGNLCGRKLLDVEVVPKEYLESRVEWSSKLQRFVPESRGGTAPDHLFDKNGCIKHQDVDW